MKLRICIDLVLFNKKLGISFPQIDIEGFNNVPIKFTLFFLGSFGFVQGNALTQDEVVKALVELFVHPNYTIPLMGCFRPIAQKIVDKAVKLLRLVPNLRSNSDRGVVEVGKDRDLNEVENVIEFYSGTGRGLDLHELVCLAFCRALELAPFFWG